MRDKAIVTLPKARDVLLLGTFAIIITCISLSSMCGWLVEWCMHSMALKQRFLVLVVGGIFAVTLLWHVWKTALYIRQLLTASYEGWSTAQETLTQMGLEPSSILLISVAQPMVFCFGFWRPRICVSTGLLELLSPAQLRAVLYHEDYHRKRRDPLRILLLETVATTFFFLPLVREWVVRFKIQIELAADRYTIAQAGTEALAGALYRLLTVTPRAVSTPPIVLAGLSATPARIALLLGERHSLEPISPQRVLSSIGTLVIVCLVFML
jgi:hypothetical protein